MACCLTGLVKPYDDISDIFIQMLLMFITNSPVENKLVFVKLMAQQGQLPRH